MPGSASTAVTDEAENVMLCASCDRCRARKTKCDGNRPCGGCVTKYKKQHGVESIEGVPYHMFSCVYSPAKRRGPHPGHKRKSNSDDYEVPEAPSRLPATPTINNHMHLLSETSGVGNTLRSYYQLAINEMFHLGNSVLSASQFAELALGALIKDDVKLAMELCNAVVHCLQESLKDEANGVSFDIAKTYYLLGVFRAYRGDFARYFKYRRVCISYLSKLPSDDCTYSLLAAVSYLDAWAYMIHNADDEALDTTSYALPANAPSSSEAADEIESKYNIRKDIGSIASNPVNQNWIQGPPPVFLNNEAPLKSRVLDAIACAFRTCCDTANGHQCDRKTPSATATAVLCHENELCSRNMVLSAYTLLQQDTGKSDGQQLVVSSMDAFFENGGEDNGLTDGQVNTLLAVCNKVIQNPLVLYHAGPTYHMITNAAALLAHLLNGMTNSEDGLDEMESTLYDEVYDTYVAIRRVLTLHRRKLPAKIRCHDLPRATVDLGETLLCSSRSCQGFVLQACSPCVAAERAKRAAEQLKLVEAQEAEAIELGELPNQNFPDFDMDDDTLLDMITGLIQQ